MQAKTILLVVMGLLLFSCNEAKKKPMGNTFNYNLRSQPTTLNPLSSTDAYATRVQNYVIEALGQLNSDTYEWEPALATKWEVSDDGLTYTYTLREGVKWHDGKPLTPEDVKFSFDAVMHPENKYNTATKKPYYENIDYCKITEDGKIEFKVKEKYFGNFDVMTGMPIIPKHIYENPTEEQEKELNKTLVGTGPYVFKEWRRGKFILLEKNKEWWGRDVYPDTYNHERFRMRFIKEENVALQRLEAGDLDFDALSAEQYVKKTSGGNWGKEVFKVQMQNKAPKGYGFIAWNLKEPMFKERDVRVALYHLIDREKMIEKYLYDKSLPATGPWYQQSPYANPDVEPVKFDPKKALELLKGAGWKDTDGDQVLDKVIDGKKVSLRFTILLPNKDFQKFLVTFQQDAKKAGVDVQIKLVEWNSFITLLNERKFEAVTLAWSGGTSLDYDPKQIWHSDSAKNGGSNFINYSNKKVDDLIDKARKTLDREKRIPMMREVYRLIAEDAPYAFMFNAKYGFYGHTKRVEKPKDTFNYEVGLKYWKIK